MGLRRNETAAQPSYAQWIRRVMTRDDAEAMPLIGSSFSEPTELLARTLRDGQAGGVPVTYESIFVNGNSRLKSLLSEAYSVAQEQVLCTTGASRALSLVYGAFVRPGEHILVERPCHDLFGILARDRQLNIDYLLRRPDDDFDLRPEELARAMRPDTRLVVLTNLHNPSGRLLSDERVAELAQVAAERNALVIVDEVYLGFVEESGRAPCAASLADNLVSINSLTKTHGLSTLRCGWIIGADAPMRVLRDYSNQHEFGVSKLAHAVAALVLARSDEYAAYRRSVIERVKPVFDHYLGELAAHGLTRSFRPGYGCIYFPVFTNIPDSLAFCRWLEERWKVIVAPGEYFGYPGGVRVGVPERFDMLEPALEAFCQGVREYAAESAVAHMRSGATTSRDGGNE